MKIVSKVRRGPAAGRSGRRATPTTTARTPDAAKIRGAVALIATFPALMGLWDLGSDEGELDVTLDPDASTVGEVYLRLLGDPDEAAATASVQPQGQRLGVLLDQREQLADNAAAAEQLDGDLRDTDLWAAMEEAAAQDELYGILDELLDAEASPLSQAERDRLAVDAGDALRTREEERTSRTAERDRTLRADAETNAEVQAASDETHLYEMLLRARRGQPVDSGDLDQALATYEALGAGDAEAGSLKAPPAARKRPR